MSKLQSLQDIMTVLPTSITGVSLSVNDKEYFNELRDEIYESNVLAGTGVKHFNEHIPFPHVHFFSHGIEFLIKLDDK